MSTRIYEYIRVFIRRIDIRARDPSKKEPGKTLQSSNPTISRRRIDMSPTQILNDTSTDTK